MLVLDGQQFLIMLYVICTLLLVGWTVFFLVVLKAGESVSGVLSGSAFLQNLTVIGIVIATGMLAMAGVLKAELVSTLLSGIVGFVLGASRQRRPALPSSEKENQR